MNTTQTPSKKNRAARLLAIAVHHYQRGRVERFSRWHKLHVQAAKIERRAALLAEVVEAQKAVDIAINTHADDYAAEATALLAAIQDARDAGATPKQIEAAKWLIVNEEALVAGAVR